jgi:hypothetical protein
MANADDNVPQAPTAPVAPPHPGRDPDAPVPPLEHAADEPAPAKDDAAPADAPDPDQKPGDPAVVDPTHPLTSKLLQIIDDADILAPVLVGILVLAMIFYGRPLVQFMINASAARALIALAISLSTIGLAFLLVFQAFRTNDDRQFQRGREIYGGLIGIFGTIIGFYFGSTGGSPADLDVEQLKVTTEAVSFHVKGGQPPYTATVSAKGTLASDGTKTLDENKPVTVDLNGNANYVLSEKVGAATVTVDVKDSANRVMSRSGKYPSDETAAQQSRSTSAPANPAAATGSTSAPEKPPASAPSPPKTQ